MEIHIKPHHEKKTIVPFANDGDADQPGQPRCLIRVFAICCLDSIITLGVVSKISRLLLVSAAEQASLSLTLVS